ncbi:hypothetical protein HanXRQr2_Chr17g0810841 [Helianthus annuus]|uniref:Uncharacterized protein n=1 Tax=Helianthus annuus TaxID=4232 RepID=A0A9K3GV42_HELAN|nr:hypothetical protein HanXRQr2_Chr17g0810841 [Helianthus annuus]
MVIQFEFWIHRVRFGSSLGSVRALRVSHTSGQIQSKSTTRFEFGQPRSTDFGSGSDFSYTAPVNSGQTQLTQFTRLTPLTRLTRSTQTRSTQSTFRHKDSEYCRMHASKSSLRNDITKSYLASFAQEYSGEFITPPFYGFTFF